MYCDISWSEIQCEHKLGVCVSSIDYPLRKRSWQRVEQQGEEQRCDEQDQGEDDVLLVASPHQVEETLEWIDKPREGGVWTAGGEREERRE